MNLTKRTTNGMGIMTIATIIKFVLQFSLLIILARLLTPTEFGIAAGAMIVIGFSEIFSQMGVSPAIVQKENLNNKDIKTGFVLSVLIGIAVSACIFFFSAEISFIIGISELESILKVSAFVFAFQSIAVVAEALLQRDLNFIPVVKADVISYTLGYGLVSIILASMGYGVWSLIIGHISQVLLKSTIFIYYAPHSVRIGFSKKSFKELLNFGTGFTIARFFNYIATQGDNFIVARLLGTEALGLYSRTYQLMKLPATMFGQVLDKVLFPAMAKVQNEGKKLNKAYNTGVTLVAILVIPSSVMAILLAPELILILLGDQWSEMILPFQLLAIGMYFRTSYKMSESLARAKGAVYRRAWRQSIYALSVLALGYIGHFWGLEGVVIGVLGALMVNFFLMANLSLDLLESNWSTFINLHVRPILFSIILTLVILLQVTIFRENNLNEYLIVMISSFSFLILIGGMICVKPKFLLGNSTDIVVQIVKSYIKKKK